jgi:ribokinase
VESTTGENSILLFPGANEAITQADMNEFLLDAQPGETLVMQNEISQGPYLMTQAHRKGMKIVFNPSPFPKDIWQEFPMDCVHVLIVNQVEAKALPDSLFDRMKNLQILVVTMGKEGVKAIQRNGPTLTCPAVRVQALDTTGAGDAFVGGFVSGLDHLSLESCLQRGVELAAECVKHQGA